MSSEKMRRLLIVEDDPALQKQIRWAFDQYETLTASDRESALAQIRRHSPPVVTMDLGLPPGPDFRKWLSRLQELQLEGTLRTRKEALLMLGQIAPVEQNTLAEYLEKLAL